MKVFLEISAWLRIFVRQFQRECCHKPSRKGEFQGSKQWPDFHCNGCIGSILVERILGCLKKKETILLYFLFIVFFCQKRGIGFFRNCPSLVFLEISQVHYSNVEYFKSSHSADEVSKLMSIPKLREN